ncbi:MAG: hypothetical protein ACJZ4F_04110, partial [Candidatus Thalassarchaeaceae archaeon]
KLNCFKNSYPNKKAARKAAKSHSKSSFGGFSAKFVQYYCNDCNQWHITTSNRKQMKYNSQHSRGGRSLRRRC